MNAEIVTVAISIVPDVFDMYNDTGNIITAKIKNLKEDDIKIYKMSLDSIRAYCFTNGPSCDNIPCASRVHQNSYSHNRSGVLVTTRVSIINGMPPV